MIMWLPNESKGSMNWMADVSLVAVKAGPLAVIQICMVLIEHQLIGHKIRPEEVPVTLNQSDLLSASVSLLISSVKCQ